MHALLNPCSPNGLNVTLWQSLWQSLESQLGCLTRGCKVANLLLSIDGLRHVSLKQRFEHLHIANTTQGRHSA